MAAPTIEQLMEQGMEHHRKGKLNDAEAAFRQVLTRQPNHAHALYYLGAVAFGRNQPKQAIELILRAIQLAPNEPLYHGNLGVLFATQNAMEDAIKAMRRCVELMPSYPDGYLNLGSALFQSGKLDEAIEAYEKALEQNPKHYEAAVGLAKIHKKREDAPQAVKAYQRAADIKPELPEIWSSLGWALTRVQEYEKAVDAYRKAVQLKPDFAEALSGLGFSLQACGRLEEAIVEKRKAIALQPHRPVLHGNLGMLLLLQGNFEEGWSEYEWRCQTAEWSRDPAKDRFNQPRWDGSDLNGKRILLHPEQGFGDTIHFVRYASLLAERGGKVVVECYKPLVRILQTVPGVVEVAEAGKPLPEFDVQSSLMSLPMLFETRLETIPSKVPYLFATPESSAKWKERIASVQQSGLKVGINWAGQPKHENDRERSIKLEELAPLAEAKGVQFYSLQKEHGGEQAKTPPPGMILHDWMAECEDFADSAGLIDNLDLIITVDTAVAHVSGAMGKPVWAMIPSTPDWRWMLKREDSPWYPTMRLFRKPGMRDWSPVVQRIAKELKALAEK